MINDILIVTLLLSIVGGITSAIYLATKRYIYKFTSAKFMVFLSTLVIFTFVVPVYKMMYRSDELVEVLQDQVPLILAETETLKSMFFQFLEKSEISVTISRLWMSGAVVYVLLTLLYYVIWIQTIRKFSAEIESPSWKRAFLEACHAFQISPGRIELLSNPKFVQPCITGVWKKYIMIPEHLIDKLNSEEITLVLQHELTHGKRNDVALKLWMNILNCLHWYNPLLYALRQDLDDWIEMACDEEVIGELSVKEKKAYVFLLMKLVEEGKKQKKYALSFGGSKTKNFKRRTYGIMKQNPGKKMIAKGLILTMIFAVIIGASVTAKELDAPINRVFSENIEVFDASEVTEVEDWMVADEFSQYESVDEVKLLDGSQGNAEINHTHQFIDTKLSQHKKKSDGSCVVTIYYAKKCSSCGFYTLGDIYSQTTYAKCPH